MPEERSHVARGVRDLRHDGAGQHWRGDHDVDALRRCQFGAGDRERDRLRLVRVWLRRQHRRHRQNDPTAVAGHQHGCLEKGQEDRRRRPGHHVRLRLRPDEGVDAVAHHAGAQAGNEADRGAQEEGAALPGSRWEDTGDGGVSRRQACASRLRRDRRITHRSRGDARRQTHDRRSQTGDRRQGGGTGGRGPAGRADDNYGERHG